MSGLSQHWRWYLDASLVNSTRGYYLNWSFICRDRLVYAELKYMVFYYVTTRFKWVIINWTEYSFLSQQSVKGVPKRAGFLSLSRISELVWDNESYEVEAASDNTSEGERGFEE